MRKPSAPSHNCTARIGHQGSEGSAGGADATLGSEVGVGKDMVAVLKKELLLHVFKGFQAIFYLKLFKYVRY